MKVLPAVYRVLAYVVGVLLAFCSLTSILKYLAPEDSGPQRLGEDLAFMWAFHGFIYIIYFVVAFLLAMQAGWTLQFTLVMFAAGLIPLLMFWVERVVSRKLREDQLGLDRLDQRT